MKFSNKLSLLIFTTGLTALTILSFAIYKLNYDSVIVSQSRFTQSIANEVSDDINLMLSEKIKIALTLANNNTIIRALEESIASYADMTTEKREESIKQLNEKWKSTKDPADNFILEFTDNKTAQLLKKQQTLLKDEYGEIFLTNKFGALVASTAKLSTFAHGHKYWWIGSYNNGKGEIFFDDRGYDDSVGGYVLGLVVPVKKGNQIIGILKCNLNILGSINKLIAHTKDNLIGEFKLTRSSGLVVFEEGFEPLSTNIHDNILKQLKNKTQGLIIIDDAKEKYLVSFSQIQLTKDEKGYGFGGTFESIDHKKGNKGESWYALCYRQMSVIQEPLIETVKLIFFIGSAVIFILMATSYFFGKKIAKPLTILNKATSKIGKGDFEYTIDISQNDEFGNLAHSFNSMTNKLQKTTTSIKLLEKEVADRKQAERNLSESEKKYRLLAESMNDVIVLLSPTGKILYVSPSVKKFGGYDSESEIGNDILKYFVNDIDIIRAAELFEKVLETHESGNFEFLFKPKDKNPFPVEHTYYPIITNNKITAIQLVLRDITERKLVEQELKYSKLQLEAVLNNINALVYIADMESYEMLFMNTHMKELFGKDLIGTTCWKSLHENQSGPCDFCTNDKLIDANGVPKEPYIWEIYNQILKKWYQLHDQAIPWTDGKLVRIEVGIDITDRKQSEEEREKLIGELQTALAEIKTLSGLLPICASCKKIRDDKGYWNQIEEYIQKYSEAKFSHGMCPECSDKLYGKEDWYIEMKKEEQQKE